MSPPVDDRLRLLLSRLARTRIALDHERLAHNKSRPAIYDELEMDYQLAAGALAVEAIVQGFLETPAKRLGHEA